jgi:hypothetical protein
MKTRFSHPLWVHLPAVVVLIVFVSTLIMSLPLPDHAPTHFGPDGQADNWGSPLISMLLLVGLGILFIVISIIISELWARQEQSKAFNPLSLLDDVFTSAMTAMGIQYLRVIPAGGESFSLPWRTVLLFSGPVVIAGIILEHFRPYRPYEHLVARTDTTSLRTELAQRMKSGQPIAYQESQNPGWVTMLSVATPAVMFAGAIVNLTADVAWVSVLLIVLGVLMMMMVGGLRTMVTRDSVSVRLGTPGFRVLNLTVHNIAGMEIRNFAPLRDFGGYGIRQNREMRAYYLRGNAGVLLTTTEGKKHLVGSDHPERLAEVIRAVAGLGSAPPPVER